MSDPLANALTDVSHVPGVRGALVVEAEAGVPVVSEVQAGRSTEAIAALSAALFRRAERASAAGGYGALETLHLESEDGHVLVAGAGELLLVVLAEPDAQLGLVRVEAQRAAESLR